MNTKLYFAPGAASLCVHWLLIELDLPHELIKLDLQAKQQKTPEYLILNPAGVVPTLVMDGKVMTEAAAIVMSLADQYVEKEFAPKLGTAQREQYHEWMFRLANTLQPALRLWWYPSDVLNAEMAADETQNNMVRSKAEERIAQVYERLNSHMSNGRDFILGEKVSALDCYATMLMRWSRNTRTPANAWPHLRAYIVRMRARPSFATLYGREGLTEWNNEA